MIRTTAAVQTGNPLLQADRATKIEVERLDFSYGRCQALRGVNLTIRERQISALIGPSGCGKSTFLRTLNRMNDIIENVRIEGNVFIDGEDIYHDRINIVNL